MASAKPVEGVNCDGPALEAIPIVLGLRLQELYEQRKRALDFKDPEGVHDMRVTSRRTRSALRDFMPLLRKTKLAASARDLKRLADVLGTVRDQDVALIALEKFKSKAPPEVVLGIQRIIDGQNVQLVEQRKELVALLKQQSLLKLKSDFLDALELASVPARTQAKVTTNPGPISYRGFARDTILDRLRELEALSSSLYEPLKAKPLHKMRIAAKRLRYALELFAPCWGDSLNQFAANVAKLQTDLGELHDCDVWIERFGNRLSKAEGKKGAAALSVEERAATVWLMGHFTKVRARHFRSALTRWNEWKTRDFINQLTASLEK